MSTGAEGLLLEDAIQAYGDPQLLEAYRAAVNRRQAIPSQSSLIGRKLHPWNDAAYARMVNTATHEIAAVEQALHKEFKQRLRSGELIATGFKQPITDKFLPESIAPALWDVFNLDVSHNRVGSRDLVYCGVRIRPAAEGAILPSAVPEDRGIEVAPSTPTNVSFPGRRSVMNKVNLHMQRRASEGLLRPTLAEESEELAMLIAHELPAEQTPTAKSIRNALRDQYNQLKARYTGPKLNTEQ